MVWTVEYIKEAVNDLKELDHSQQIQVLKAIQKVSANPLPNTEGGYGKPLGNHLSSNLAGYLKIKLLTLGIRVIYCLVREKEVMKIIIISVHDDQRVCRIAQERIKKEK